MTKERRLGRGLEALLGQLPGWTGAAPGQPPPGMPSSETATNASENSPGPSTIPIRAFDESAGAQPDSTGEMTMATVDPRKPLTLAIDRIERNPHQPRQEFDPDELQKLSESITSHGLLQPVVVRPLGDHYQLIAGERRLRAARQAGWTEVPVVIVDADDRQTAELAIVENMQRKDLNALEKAGSFQRYLQQYGGTQEELAARLNLDRSTIANLIRLLELPQPVQDALRRGKITQGHARALLPLGEEREQIAFCDRIQKEALNVRQTEAIVQETIAADAGRNHVAGQSASPAKPQRRTSDQIAALEQEFRAALGVRVKITHNARGRGKMVIAFANHEEFDQIRGHICGAERPARRTQAS